MASLTVWMQIKGRRSIIFVVVFWPGAIFEFVQKVDFWGKKVAFYSKNQGSSKTETAASLKQFAEKTARFCDNVRGH